MWNISRGKLSGSLPGEIESRIHRKNWSSDRRSRRMRTVAEAFNGIRDFKAGIDSRLVGRSKRIDGNLNSLTADGKTVSVIVFNYSITRLPSYPIFHG